MAESSPQLSPWATQLRRNITRWRAVINTVLELTGPKIERQTTRADSNVLKLLQLLIQPSSNLIGIPRLLFSISMLLQQESLFEKYIRPSTLVNATPWILEVAENQRSKNE